MKVSAEPSTAVRRAERRAPTVLQVLPAMQAGAMQRATVEVAAGLARAGWRAIVASAGGAMEYELGRAGAEHCGLPLDRQGPLAIARNAERLARLIRHRHIDLVHARAPAPAWSAYLAARRTGRAFVTAIDAVPDRNPLRHWYNVVLAKGDAVIASTAAAAEEMRRRYRIDERRLFTIRRGIDAETFNPAQVTSQRIVQLAHAWRLGEGVNVMLLPDGEAGTAGRKRFLAALAKSGRDDLTAVLLGVDEADGRARDEIERFARRRRLGLGLRLVADCRDMPAAYMLVDVVVVPSVPADGFSPAIAEAQAMGRPVVALARDGAGGMVRDGETGWLVRPGAEGELARALAAAVSLGPEQRQRLAKAARAGIERRYSLAEMQARTLEVYRSLLSGRR